MEKYTNANLQCEINIKGELTMEIVFSNTVFIELDNVNRIGSYLSVSHNGSENQIEGIIVKGFGELHFTGKLGPAGVVDACFEKSY